MKIYVETNFFLELVFSHEQSKYCEKIISLCRRKKADLIMPAYTFAEALYKLEAQRKEREIFRKSLNAQLSQLTRTSLYTPQVKNFRALENFLIQNVEEEKIRFEKYRRSLTKIAEIISFDAQVIQKAKQIETKYDLTLQDSIVFHSVLNHLKKNKASPSCFLNKNSKDFNTIDIKKRLKALTAN